MLSTVFFMTIMVLLVMMVVIVMAMMVMGRGHGRITLARGEFSLTIDCVLHDGHSDYMMVNMVVNGEGDGELL